jgi:hypothetical protein
MECSYAPAFNTALFGMEFPLMEPLQEQQFLEVGPTQLSRQRSDSVATISSSGNASLNCIILRRFLSAKPLPNSLTNCRDSVATIGSP